nr:BAG-associated GRAM protein 1-like isoform X2 [Ipomoea trifida]
MSQLFCLFQAESGINLLPFGTETMHSEEREQSMLRANSSSFKASNISPQESVPKVEKFLPFVKEEVLSGIYNDVFPCTAEQFSELLLGSGSNFMREYRALRKDTNLAVFETVQQAHDVPFGSCFEYKKEMELMLDVARSYLKSKLPASESRKFGSSPSLTSDIKQEDRKMRRERGTSMGGSSLIFGAVFMYCLVVAAVAEEQLSTKECENLGFTGLALCSDCRTLSEYVKDQEVVSDCLKCCTEDSDDATSKVVYAGAVIEVCMRKLVFYPEIVGFIEEEKDKFPSVKVQYAYNSPPKLIMLDGNGGHKETVRIDNWKREHILQFLTEKVKPSSDI